MVSGVDIESDKIRLFQLNGTYEAFGLVMDFVVQTPPFAHFEAKPLADAILQQLRLGNHLVALEGKRVVGYVGWLHTSRAIAEAWVEGSSKLVAVSPQESDAAALTIVYVNKKEATRPLLRGARELNPGRRAYFKRDSYGTQGARKRSVANTTSARKGGR